MLREKYCQQNRGQRARETCYLKQNTLKQKKKKKNYMQDSPIIGSVERKNKLLPSFSGFKSERFFHDSSHDGVSVTENDEQPFNNAVSVFHP